jgi:hypothetical protein
MQITKNISRDLYAGVVSAFVRLIRVIRVTPSVSVASPSGGFIVGLRFPIVTWLPAYGCAMILMHEPAEVCTSLRTKLPNFHRTAPALLATPIPYGWQTCQKK